MSLMSFSSLLRARLSYGAASSRPKQDINRVQRQPNAIAVQHYYRTTRLKTSTAFRLSSPGPHHPPPETTSQPKYNNHLTPGTAPRLRSLTPGPRKHPPTQAKQHPPPETAPAPRTTHLPPGNHPGTDQPTRHQDQTNSQPIHQPAAACCGHTPHNAQPWTVLH